MAMMMMAEDPERRRRVLQEPMSTTAAVLSPGEYREATNTGSSVSEGTVQKEGEEELSDEEDEEFLEKEDGQVGNTNNNNNYSINHPNSLSTPSPAGSLKSNESSSSTGGTGCGGGANSTTRRIFTPEFKQSVLDSFTNDPACIGNQRATARKFNIHRRQVQKWLQQLTGQASSDNNKDQQQPSSDEQEQKVKKSDKDLTPNPPSSSSPSVSLPSRGSILAGKCTATNSKAKSRSSRPRAKMPIVAGKGPLIPLQASAVSSSPSASLPSSSPLMSINGKGLGNIHHPLFSNSNSNLFMGLASPLLSSLPLALEACNSRHVSPPPMQSPSSNGIGQVNGGRHSASHNHNNGNNNMNGSLSAQRMMELVDELCHLYPSEDFSLLRRAMLKNEVSFTKLSPPLRKHRKNSSSPSPGGNDYITQQTLQMIKNQNEYFQLLQSGYANLSQFQDLSDHSNNGKYASWLNNPFAAAAVGAYNLQGGNTTNTTKHGSGLDTNRKQQRGNNNITLNGNGNNHNHHHDLSASQHHNFASPKAPVSNSKSKTVAAVLASQRNGPTSQRLPNSSYDKTKRPSQNRRKMTNGRPVKSFPTPPNNNDDDYLDPTSMLEVVTSKPSPMDNMESYGMDLSTTKANNTVIQRSPTLITTSSTIRSKAMNKDYGFLSELGLVRKQQETNLTNGYTSPPPLSSTASLEHFVDNVLSMRRSSPHTSSSGSPPGHELNYATNNNNNNNNNFESSDRSKNSVLEAFNYDPELAGDARGVARKFGLNIRVVQKWIREAPTRSIQMNNNDHGENGDDAQFDDEDNENFPLQHQHLYQQRSVIASTSTHSVNKRKNPKPNQICDFTEDDLDENGALDMVVPIKKRRVSTPPTPTTA
ncbi:hypothetical protein Fcan01_01768 [Folsomia candida]|uniref:Brinker DNA-binding domain-containing protein n=2 Tax=Folsomia candida TaxID=158441 RepID=A0A226EVY3_FOLCA|nr:hypothetical protein Fcan01_01768 [Folsomia candida]